MTTPDTQSAGQLVAIVVDPVFGDRLATLAARCHVWAVDTPTNRAATEPIWAASPGYTQLRGVTLFQVFPPEDRAAWLLDVLENVELHHHSPPWRHVAVYGVALTEKVREGLEAYGFAGFQQGDEEFTAERDATPH